MKSKFGRIFVFFANLAWKNRLTFPLLIAAAFMITDMNFQVRFSIRRADEVSYPNEITVICDEKRFQKNIRKQQYRLLLFT